MRPGVIALVGAGAVAVLCLGGLASMDEPVRSPVYPEPVFTTPETPERPEFTREARDG